jgi:hypothetical protein
MNANEIPATIRDDAFKRLAAHVAAGGDINETAVSAALGDACSAALAVSNAANAAIKAGTPDAALLREIVAALFHAEANAGGTEEPSALFPGRN